jgi:hypothetical protein
LAGITPPPKRGKHTSFRVAVMLRLRKHTAVRPAYPFRRTDSRRRPPIVISLSEQSQSEMSEPRYRCQGLTDFKGYEVHPSCGGVLVRVAAFG